MHNAATPIVYSLYNTTLRNGRIFYNGIMMLK